MSLGWGWGRGGGCTPP